MTRPEQTAREREYVARVAALLNLPVVGDPVSGDPKHGEPDVLITLQHAEASRRVGVEVRDLDDQERSESWRSTLPRFQDRVRERLARDGINVLVSGYLHVEDVPMVRSRLASSSAAETIAAFAREWLASPTDLPVHKSVLRRSGLEMFRHIMFNNSASPDVWFVTSGLPLVGDAVQDAIDDKAEKLRKRYQHADVDEVWLLLVARDPISGYVDPTGGGGAVYVSPFARTVFLDARRGECVELETTPD